MKDVWKINQIIYNKLFVDDLLENYKFIEITNIEDIIYNSIDYFYNKNDILIYPSKSYSVAIIYARLLSENFGNDIYYYLNDKDLLFNNDPYFKTYNDSKYIYDRILDKVGLNFCLNSGWVDVTVDYFNKECLGVIDFSNVKNNL